MGSLYFLIWSEFSGKYWYDLVKVVKIIQKLKGLSEAIQLRQKQEVNKKMDFSLRSIKNQQSLIDQLRTKKTRQVDELCTWAHDTVMWHLSADTLFG